jgi:hypothetical protein
MNKQETLEESAERYSEELLEAKTIQPHEKTWIKAMFIWVAKWQAEKMYSEEEVHNIITSYKNNRPKVFLKVFYNEWFEQFKKK